MGVGAILDTAKQALFAQQRALQLVGQNIANVNTPGYSRETPVFLAAGPSHSDVMRSGVSVDQVTRVYDRFVTGQVNTATARSSSTQTQADYLGQIEGLFNDLNLEKGGLATNLDQFFEAFQGLANNPSGLAERSIVQAQGQAVTDQFHSLYGRLADLRRDVNTVLQDDLTNVNGLTKQIAQLNLAVQQVEGNPKNNANTLRDQRDLLLKQLSEKIPVTSFETNDGALTVLLGGGRPLVEGDRAGELVAVPNPDDPLQSTIQLQDKNGSQVDVSASITAGKLQGLVEVRDTYLPRFLSSLDRLAAQFGGAVNEQHSAGYGLDGNTGHLFFTPRTATGRALADNTGGSMLQPVKVFDPTKLTLDDYRITFNSPASTFDVVNTTTGATVLAGQTYTSGSAIRFDGLAVTINDRGTAPTTPQPGDTFTMSTTKGAARDIAVDPAILQDTKTIAAGQTPGQGDNANASAMANLKDAAQLDGATLSGFYNTLVSNIGIESQNSSSLAEHQKLLLTGVENQRESLAGVSLDEEQVDLIRFQQAFAAAANLIHVSQQLSDEVINMIR
jgi:flagellar hook-associated protein 1 FlgK